MFEGNDDFDATGVQDAVKSNYGYLENIFYSNFSV